MRLQQFDFEVLYRKGVDNPANDSLSRYPQQATKYDLREVIEPLYISEPVDEQEENIADFFSCPVCTSHLGVHAPNRMKVTSVSEHLACSRHQHAL